MVRICVALGVGILGLILLAGVAETQDTKKDSGKVKGQLPPGWKNLNLTPEQKSKLYEVQASYKMKINDLSKQIKQLVEQEKQEMA